MGRMSIALVAVCLIISPPQREALPQARLRSVWIDTDLGFGSGVIVRSGLILTNRHVVDGASSIRVNDKKASVLREDPSADLALLTSPTANLSPISTETRTRIGEPVFYVGNPGGVRNYVGRGTILDYPDGLIHSSTYAWFGFSGSGLYDRAGRLIGVQVEVTAQIGSLPEGLAIPAAEIKRFLDQ